MLTKQSSWDALPDDTRRLILKMRRMEHAALFIQKKWNAYLELVGRMVTSMKSDMMLLARHPGYESISAVISVRRGNTYRTSSNIGIVAPLANVPELAQEIEDDLADVDHDWAEGDDIMEMPESTDGATAYSRGVGRRFFLTGNLIMDDPSFISFTVSRVYCNGTIRHIFDRDYRRKIGSNGRVILRTRPRSRA